MTSQQMALRRVGHYGQPFWRENDPLLILSCPAPNGQVQQLLPRSLVAAESGAPSPEHSANYVIVTFLRDMTLATRMKTPLAVPMASLALSPGGFLIAGIYGKIANQRRLPSRFQSGSRARK